MDLDSDDNDDYKSEFELEDSGSDVSNVEDNAFENTSSDETDEDEPPKIAVEEEKEEQHMVVDDSINVVYTTESGFKWNSLPSKTKAKNPDRVTSSGLLDKAADVSTIREAFSLFITDEIIDTIVEYTNQHCSRYENLTDRYVTKAEIYAFISILLAAGFYRHGSKWYELWAPPVLFKPLFFRVVMSRTKFTYILGNIHFDDKTTRLKRFAESDDKLEPIRTIFDDFSNACSKYYSPGFNVVVEERFVPYKEKCPFLVTMNNKPGMKFWTVVDGDTSYVLHIKPCLKKSHNTKEMNRKTAFSLLRTYYESGRGVLTDESFTSIAFAKALSSKKLMLTGILTSNKSDIPMEFLPSPQREDCSTVFGFASGLTLVSYVPRSNESVVLLSTQFHDRKKSSFEQDRKPQILLHYEKVRKVIAEESRVSKENSCAKHTKKWSVRFFMEILDIALHNAYIVWLKKCPEWKKNDHNRRETFMRDLTMELSKDNVAVRKKTVNRCKKDVNLGVDLYSRLYMDEDSCVPSAQEEDDCRISIGTRCKLCTKGQRLKTKLICFYCRRTVCHRHRRETKRTTCFDCVNNV